MTSQQMEWPPKGFVYADEVRPVSVLDSIIQATEELQMKPKLSVEAQMLEDTKRFMATIKAKKLAEMDGVSLVMTAAEVLKRSVTCSCGCPECNVGQCGACTGKGY